MTETPAAATTEQQKPHVSPSAMDMMLRCGEQYRRRYVLGEKTPPGVALIKGRAVHRAAEVNFRQKITSGVDLKLSDLTEAAAAEVDTSVSTDGLEMTDEERKVGARNVIGQVKDASVRLTGLFHREVAPTVQPVLVEEFVRVELPNASHDLLGKLDVVDAQGVIRDLKTASRKKIQSDADNSDQLTYYAVAYRHLTGRDATKVALDVLVDTKTPNYQLLTSDRTKRDTQVLLAKTSAVIASVKAGVFLPAAAGSWCCTPKFCGYWSTCPYVNAERKAAAEAANY